MIILYSTGCPKCKVLESMLDARNIDYKKIVEEVVVTEVGRTNGIMSVPILQIDNEYMDFGAAVKYLKNRER